MRQRPALAVKTLIDMIKCGIFYMLKVKQQPAWSTTQKIIKLNIKVQKQSHTSSAPALNHHSISLLTSVEYGREMPNVFAGVHGQKCLCQISVHVVGNQWLKW